MRSTCDNEEGDEQQESELEEYECWEDMESDGGEEEDAEHVVDREYFLLHSLCVVRVNCDVQFIAINKTNTNGINKLFLSIEQ